MYCGRYRITLPKARNLGLTVTQELLWFTKSLARVLQAVNEMAVVHPGSTLEAYSTSLTKSTEPLSLCSKSYSALLSSGLRDLRLQEQLCDVVLIAQGNGRSEAQRFGCHRAVLAALSPFFCKMFTGGFRETTEREVPLQEDDTVVRQLLEFFYSGRCEVGNVEEALELARAANYFAVDSLALECLQYVRENITVDNCVAVVTAVSSGLFAASLNEQECRQLLERAMWFLLHEFETISLAAVLPYLALETLTGVLNNEKLCVRSEDTVVRVAVEWLRQNLALAPEEVRELNAEAAMEKVRRVLACIYLPALSKKQHFNCGSDVGSLLAQCGYSGGQGEAAMRVLALMEELEEMQVASVEGEREDARRVRVHPRASRQQRASRTLCSIDARQLHEVYCINTPNDACIAVDGVAVSHKLIVVAFFRPAGRIEVWNAEKREQVAVLLGHSRSMNVVGFLPFDENQDEGHLRLVSCAGGRQVRVWNMHDFSCEREVDVGVTVTRLCTHVSSTDTTYKNRSLLVTGHYDGAITLWDTATWEVLRLVDPGLKSNGKNVETRCLTALSCNSYILAGATNGGLVRIFSTENWSCLKVLQFRNSVQSVLLHNQVRHLLSLNLCIYRTLIV